MWLDEWTTNPVSGDWNFVWDLQQNFWECNQRRLFGIQQPCWYLHASKRLLCHPKERYNLRCERFYILTWNYVLGNCWHWNSSNRFKGKWMHINYPSRHIWTGRRTVAPIYLSDTLVWNKSREYPKPKLRPLDIWSYLLMWIPGPYSDTFQRIRRVCRISYTDLNWQILSTSTTLWSNK